MDAIIQSMIAVAPSYAPFIMVIIIMAIVLYRAHRNKEHAFTIFDLIEDEETGKGSLEKVGMMFAMLSITWWFIDDAAKGKIGVEEVLAYGGIMGLAKFADKWLNKKYKLDSPDPLQDDNKEG